MMTKVISWLMKWPAWCVSTRDEECMRCSSGWAWSPCCTANRRAAEWCTSWRTILEEGAVDGEGELVKVGAAPDGRNCRQETQQLSDGERAWWEGQTEALKPRVLLVDAQQSSWVRPEHRAGAGQHRGSGTKGRATAGGALACSRQPASPRACQNTPGEARAHKHSLNGVIRSATKALTSLRGPQKRGKRSGERQVCMGERCSRRRRNRGTCPLARSGGYAVCPFPTVSLPFAILTQ